MSRSILYVALLCIFTQQALTINLSGEFFTGFESGIFLRTNPKMLDEYGCPSPKYKREEFQQMQAVI